MLFCYLFRPARRLLALSATAGLLFLRSLVSLHCRLHFPSIGFFSESVEHAHAGIIEAMLHCIEIFFLSNQDHHGRVVGRSLHNPHLVPSSSLFRRDRSIPEIAEFGRIIFVKLVISAKKIFEAESGRLVRK